MRQTRSQTQVLMDKRLDALEKGTEALKKELEDLQSSRTTLLESVAELKRMVGTMIKEKGVGSSTGPTTNPIATTVGDFMKFSVGGGSTGHAQTQNEISKFRTIRGEAVPGFSSGQTSSEHVFVYNLVGHNATASMGHMGPRDTMPVLHNYFNGAHHIGHNTFTNPYLTTGFGGTGGGTHGPGPVMHMGQPVVVNAATATANSSLPMFGGGNPESWLSRIE